MCSHLCGTGFRMANHMEYIAAKKSIYDLLQASLLLVIQSWAFQVSDHFIFPNDSHCLWNNKDPYFRQSHLLENVNNGSSRVVKNHLVVKNLPANAGDMGSIPGSGRSPGDGNGNPLQYSCMRKSHGQRSLVGCSPWGRKELNMTEHAYAHTNTHRISLNRGWMNNPHSSILLSTFLWTLAMWQGHDDVAQLQRAPFTQRPQMWLGGLIFNPTWHLVCHWATIYMFSLKT